MSKKIFIFFVTTIVFFTSFLAYKRIINAANDENPSSGYNPEEHFERVLAEDQNANSPDSGKTSISFKKDTTVAIQEQEHIVASGKKIKNTRQQSHLTHK